MCEQRKVHSHSHVTEAKGGQIFTSGWCCSSRRCVALQSRSRRRCSRPSPQSKPNPWWGRGARGAQRGSNTRARRPTKREGKVHGKIPPCAGKKGLKTLSQRTSEQIWEKTTSRDHIDPMTRRRMEGCCARPGFDKPRPSQAPPPPRD